MNKIIPYIPNLVPLANVASLEVTEGQIEIKRFDYKRSKTLTGDVDGVIMNSMKANNELKRIFTELATKYNDVSLVFQTI